MIERLEAKAASEQKRKKCQRGGKSKEAISGGKMSDNKGL